METPQKKPKGAVPAKFVLKKETMQVPNHKIRYDEGLALLIKKQNEIIAERKKRKKIAAEALSKDPKNHQLQDKFAEALIKTHVTTKEFIDKLGPKNFVIKDNIIHYQNVPIAKLLDTDDKEAFTEVKQAIGPGYSPIYKRVNLDGHSDKEYVSMKGSMLRRHAYRGITPPERDLFFGKKPLAPYYSDDLFRETPGRHFNDNGSSFERAKTTTSDVEFLQSIGSIKNDAFPADERGLLSFTQVRQGASKVLSGTSTNHEIKSNHGEGFNKFGFVKIDLAKMPTDNVLHHYNAEAFDTGKVREMIQKINEQSMRANYNDTNPAPKDEVIRQQAMSTIRDSEIESHVSRGNLSSARNREILFTVIPNESITAFTASSSKKEYNAEFIISFKNKVDELFIDIKYSVVTNEMIGNTDDVALAKLKNYTQSYTKEQGNRAGYFAAINYMNELRKKENDRVAALPKPRKHYVAQYGTNRVQGNKKWNK